MLLEVQFSKIGRECNKVAYELARLAIRTMQYVVWRGRFSICISELLKLDCNVTID